MDPQISIEAEFKDGKLHTGMDRAVAKEERMEEGWKKITKSAAQAEKEIERFAKRTTEINATPVERYLAAQVKLHDSLARGLITQQTYNTALARTKAEYQALEDAANGAREAEEGRAKAADESSRREQFASKLRANSVKLEYQENLRLIAERKVAEAQATKESTQREQFASKLRAGSIKMEFEENLRLIRERKAAEVEAAKAAVESRQKQIAAMRGAEQVHIDAHRSMKRAQEDALGPSFIGQIQGMVGQYMTLQAAVNLVADAFRHAKQESRDALASLKTVEDSLRNLNQVATSDEDLVGMIARADDAAKRFGVKPQVAYDVLAEARNLGIEGQFEQLMEARQFIRPEVSVQLGGKVAAMFPGQVTPMQAVNMTAVAAAQSAMKTEEFAGIMGIVGEGGGIAGAGAAESMAAVGALTPAFSSGKVAADRVRTFLTKAGLHEQLKGKGLLGSLDALQAMSPEDRQEILKTDMEMNVAYNKLTEFEDQIRVRIPAIEAQKGLTGTPDSALSQGMERAANNGAFQALTKAAQGESQLEIDRRDALAGPEADRTSVVNRLRAVGRRTGRSQSYGGMLSDYAMAAAGGLGSLLNLPAEATAGMTLAAGAAVEQGGPLAGLVNALLGQDRQFYSEALQVLKEIRANTTRNPSAAIQQRATQRAQ